MDTGAIQTGQFGTLNSEFLALHPSRGTASASRIASGGLTPWQAKRALEHIEINLGSKLEVHDLAQMIGRSVTHFAKAFTRSFGLPPMKYVATRRIERAKVMMASTSEQLSQIALACGFTDQSHLTRCFHRIVGTSPGRWRRTNL
jgi:AraC family transcriptional regulator